MTTSSPTTIIAVFERKPYWGPELQRQFEPASTLIHECRRLSDLLPAIATYESTLLLIDFDAAIEACLAWFATDVPRADYRGPIIACGSQATAELEWCLRDAGVTAFLADWISGTDMARLCRRQLGQSPPRGTTGFAQDFGSAVF